MKEKDEKINQTQTINSRKPGSAQSCTVILNQCATNLVLLSVQTLFTR